MKKITLLAALLGSAYFANAQVGIGTPAPEEASMLHIKSANKGVIIPNVPLKSTTDTSTVEGNEVNSLLVYNTTVDTSTTSTSVTPGFYYWLNDEWQRITTKAELVEQINKMGGNVGYTTVEIPVAQNPGGGIIPAESFYRIDEDGVKHALNNASLVDNTDGTYTFTAVNGDSTTINVPASVIENIQNILTDSTTINVDSNTFTTVQEYLQYVINNGEGNVGYTEDAIAADNNNGVLIPANSFYRVDSDGVKQVITFPNLIDNNNGTYTFTDVNGDTTTINIPASVVNNFTEILGDTTTYNNEVVTIKEIIEQIAAEGSGNMTFVPGTDTSTTESMLGGSYFTYINAQGQTDSVTFESLIKANETETNITRISTGSVLSNDLVITYDYINETADTATIDLTSDIKTLIEGNTDIKNAIQNVLNTGGSVFYGTIDSSTTTKVLYTIDSDGDKQPIDVVSTLINNTTLTGDTTTNVVIQNNIDNLKTNLGDKFDSTTVNQVIKTGDTWNDGKAIYKGIYNAYIVGKTALVSSEPSSTTAANTVAISLEKFNVGDIISITVLNVDGSKITTSTTDVSVSGDALKFSIGTGNMYNVLFPQATSNTEIKVLVEFSAE